MKRFLPIVCLVMLVSGGITRAATRPPDRDFELVNKTGSEIEEVYVSPTNDDDWGEDVMGKDVLEDGDSVEIKFDRSETACSWDLRVEFEDKSHAVWEKLNLCKISQVTLKYENKKPTAIVK